MTDVMALLSAAWEKRNGPAVLTTVDRDGKPNSVYVGDMKFDPDMGFVVADNRFHKTRENIQNGSPGAFLFITQDHKAYQAKGKLTYHTDGKVFEDMKVWHMQQHPGHAAVVLTVAELYSGSERLH